MKFYLGTTLIFNTVFFIHLANAKVCNDSCAACWKIGEPGVDTKWECHVTGECGNSCPPGYYDLHCAKWQRCV
ncbi:hypothetical protein BGX38DRAFT_1198056 [Terfezia claveryi]|nr:hypothetical protein BGX38DRAFT_1198056 [Terfezia claveryi]